MATQTLEWAATTKLECAGCNPANVYLCVNPDKIAQKECAEGAEDPATDFEWTSIEASILSYTSQYSSDGCGGIFYKYIISYDDEQLIADAVLLTSDIYSVVCQGCLTQWALSMIGNDVVVEDDGEGNYTLVNQHGCRFALPTGGGSNYTFDVAADSGVTSTIDNAETLIIAGGNGIDTVGSNPDTVTVSVDISADAGNIIVIGSDFGVYAPGTSCDDVIECLGTLLLLKGDEGEAEDLAYGDEIYIAGGVSIETTSSTPDTVTVDLILSTDADNSAVIGTDGNLYVPPSTVDYTFFVEGDAGTPEEIGDQDTLYINGGQCITTEVSSIDIVKIDLVISGDAHNAVLEGGDGGVFVNPVSEDADNIIVNGTDEGAYLACSDVLGCLGVLLVLDGDTGTPEDVDYGDVITIAGGASIATTVSATDTVTVDLILSTDVGNTADFGTDGNLFVPAGAYTFDVDADSGTPQTIANGNTLTINGGQCVTTEVSATDIVKVDVDISSDADNAIIVGTDGGLYAAAGAAADTPTGAIVMWGSNTAPLGWSICDGAAVSRAGYAALFALIGTIYGAGDGSTTFNLPNFKQRFPLGRTTSGTGSALGDVGGAIDHTHTVPAHYHGIGTGADLAISASGSHLHTIDHDHPSGTTSTTGDHNHFCAKNIVDSSNTTLTAATTIARSSTVYDPYVLHGSGATPNIAPSGIAGDHSHTFDVAAYTGNSGSSTHTHLTGDFTGRIGLVTGGVNGNAAMTSGTQNPPFLTINFIIKQ